MAYVIAVAGKGGTGKTTLAGLMIDYLIKKGRTPILAVDADPNSNLNEVLGVEVDTTIGELREIVNDKDTQDFPGGMSRADYINYSLQQAVVEGDGFDMLVMGRPEGIGCYCYANGMLREATDKMANSYKYMFIDNEAGLEHLSRGTTKKVDVLFAVSECSKRGIEAAARVRDLVDELKLDVKKVYLIVNRVPEDGLREEIKAEIKKRGLDLAGIVPLDQMIYDYDNKGIPLVKIPESSPAIAALRKIADQKLLNI